MTSFFEELKRRNVFRVGAAYAVAGWLLMQIVDVFAPALHLPEWFPTAVAFLLMIGFPIALFFAWAFELTPEGIRRESEVDTAVSVTHETAAKLDRLTITLLVLVAGFILVDRFVLNREMGSEPFSQQASENTDTQQDGKKGLTPAPPAGQLPAPADDGMVSVAVLPFVNMSDDEQNEYFSDGISEELLNVLVKIEHLRVPSRTSSFTFKGSKQSMAEIGEALDVDHVLEGSVRKAGNRIRVTAQLIDVRTDTHLWSETYTRELDDIFAVQDEISQAIVAALRLTLSGKDAQRLAHRSTNNVAAYNKYLLGRHLWNQRSRRGLVEAVKPLREAVALDPGFGQAWAALADTYVLIPEYRAGAIDEFIPLATEAVQQALRIDPDSARALTTSGYIKYMYEYDLAGARADMQRALEIEPGYATAHQWYGEVLAVEGRIEEALAQIEIAASLDPLAPVIPHVGGWISHQAGRLEEGLRYFDRVLQISPDFEATIGNLSSLHMIMGEYDLARSRLEQYGKMQNIDVSADQALIDAMENPALKPRALALLAGSGELGDGVMEKAYSYMLLDEPMLALESLERAFEAGDPYAIHVNRMTVYDPLRSEPRFQALLKRMNLLP